MPRSRRRGLISGEKSVTMLPDELVIECLTWLPGNQLGQCKCVCKSWRSIIGSPTFMETYRSRQPGLILHWSGADWVPDEDARIRFYHCPLRRLNQPTEEFSFLYELKFNSRLNGMSQMVNGLTCVWELELGNRLSIRNVCTGEEMRIPDPARCIPTTSVVLRIGYNPASRTYKLLRLILGFSGTPLQAEIMTLRPSNTPSTWRRLNYSEAGIVELPVETIFVNNYSRLYEATTFPDDGVLCWLTPEGLVSFDVNKEKFRWVKLPEAVEDGQKIIRARFVDGRISLSLWVLPWAGNISGLGNNHPNFLTQYKLEEDDEGNRWSKHRFELPEEFGEMEGGFVVANGNPPTGEMLLVNHVVGNQAMTSRFRTVYCYNHSMNKIEKFFVRKLPYKPLDLFGGHHYQFLPYNARISCLLDSNNLYLSLDDILSGL